MRARRRWNSGFTLIEVLIAIGLGVTILGAIAAGIANNQKKAKIRGAQQQLITIATAIDQFELDNQRLPTTLSELTTYSEDLKNFPEGGYLPGKNPLQDPWKNEFEYIPEESEGSRPFTLRSKGPPNGHPITIPD